MSGYYQNDKEGDFCLMDLNESNARRMNGINEMPRVFAEIIARRLAEQARKFVLARVESKGLDQNNTPFESFSRNKIGAYSAWWGNIRQKAGRQINRVDFHFKGDMWRGFNTKEITTSNGIIHIVIGGTNAESQDKIDKNSEIFRQSIIALSETEETALKTVLKDEAIQYCKQRLGFK